MGKSIIVPHILKGTRDFLPADMARRRRVLEIMRGIFERFGFAEIETPILNPAETILGKYGLEGDRLTYAWEDAGGRRVALPYDLTVPFARYVAANWRELSMPFKRYQIQRVWRAEKPQKGRLREFYQCDIDVIGTKSLLAEAEIAAIIVEVFRSIGLPNVVIKVNSRRLLDAVLESFGIAKEKKIEALRMIDKQDKIGSREVIEALKKEGIAKPEELMALLTPESTIEATLKKFERFDLGELRKFFDYAKDFGVSERSLQFDPSLARGLDYYTGLVFEVVGKETGVGTLCAGGRYDNLCGMFCDQEFSGVGVSFGFERIMIALEERGTLDTVGMGMQALVANFGDESVAGALAIVRELTDAGVSAEMYLDPVKLEKQFKYADKKQISFVVMWGTDEAARGEVKIKDMASGTQELIPRDQVVVYFTRMK